MLRFLNWTTYSASYIRSLKKDKESIDGHIGSTCTNTCLTLKKR